MLSPYVAQVISPTGNDYLRLRTDPKRPALHYFRVKEDMQSLFNFTDALLGTEQSKEVLALEIDPADFETRLKRTASKIHIFEQEKGLESCFLTIGTINWKLGDSEGVAPILRIPCSLENKAGKWTISEIEYAEMEPNPMLSYLLHGLTSEPLKDITNAVDPIIEVKETIQWLRTQLKVVNWEINPDPIYFGCFTYHGIPLEEVTPTNFIPPTKQFWFENSITNQGLYEEPSGEVSLEIPPTILPADSSQLSVLLEIGKEKSLTIQGPPGTGKSQTIVNLIADALCHGKSVAFIAQKETALNVVFDRLPEDLKNLSIRLYQAAEMTDRTNIFSQLNKRLSIVDRQELPHPHNVNHMKLEAQMDEYGEFLNAGRDAGKISNYELLSTLIPLNQEECPDIQIDIEPSEDAKDLKYIFSNLEQIQGLAEKMSTPHWMWWGNLESNQIRQAKGEIISIIQALEIIPSLSLKDLRDHKQRRKEIAEIQQKDIRLRKELTATYNVTIDELSETCQSTWFQRITNPRLRKIHKSPWYNKEKVSSGLTQLANLQVTSKKLIAETDHDAQLDNILDKIEKLHLPSYSTTHQLVECLKYLEVNWGATTLVSQIFILLNQIQQKCIFSYTITSELLNYGTFKKASVKKIILEAIVAKRQITSNPGKMEVLRNQYRSSCKKVYQGYQIPYKTPSLQELKEGNAPRVADKRGYALIQHVAKTTKARVSVRHLIELSLPELLELFPCWFMTPSKLAQNLPRQTKLFDLIIIDEASQLLKAEAMGALARGKQFAILGDAQQMPPSTLMREDIEGEDEMENKKESILDWASSNLSSKSLLYHYRSEHHSLIAFSNDKFYNNSLYCIPSQKLGEGYGITLHYVDGAKYKPKGGDPNILEAERLILEVEKYIHKYPSRSIGLVTFNVRQQETIERLFDQLRITNPSVQKYCVEQAEAGSPLFIKNLETVQGDERDSIFISTVFGPDITTGQVYQRFGLNREGDEKRINVLITRAKKENIIITSLKPEQITSTAAGPKTLRQYLEYASTGFLPTTLHPTKAAGNLGGFDSPWEEWFYDRLLADGFEVENQVGVGRWKIDLAVKGLKGTKANGYVCGIELDGAAYHSSLLARERDALRQDVLEAHGWTIFRVWSTDYFYNPEGEYLQLKTKILELCQTS